jgi:hypothetical protein
MQFKCFGRALKTVHKSSIFPTTEILSGAVAVVAGIGCPLCHRSHLQAGQDHGPGSFKVKTTFVTSVLRIGILLIRIRIRLSILMPIRIRICFLP